MESLVLSEKARKQLADAYAEAQGPFPLTIDGQDFVVMSMADFEEYCGLPSAEDEQHILREDYTSAMCGELVDAKEALAGIRAKYGL